MQNLHLTKENFWNEMYKAYPLPMADFCAWIDVYKQENQWHQLFNDFSMSGISSPKYHDIPLAMQFGIFLQFAQERDAGGWVFMVSDLDIRKEITTYLAMSQGIAEANQPAPEKPTPQELHDPEFEYWAEELQGLNIETLQNRQDAYLQYRRYFEQLEQPRPEFVTNGWQARLFDLKFKDRQTAKIMVYKRDNLFVFEFLHYSDITRDFSFWDDALPQIFAKEMHLFTPEPETKYMFFEARFGAEKLNGLEYLHIQFREGFLLPLWCKEVPMNLGTIYFEDAPLFVVSKAADVARELENRVPHLRAVAEDKAAEEILKRLENKAREQSETGEKLDKVKHLFEVGFEKELSLLQADGVTYEPATEGTGLTAAYGIRFSAHGKSCFMIISPNTEPISWKIDGHHHWSGMRDREKALRWLFDKLYF